MATKAVEKGYFGELREGIRHGSGSYRYPNTYFAYTGQWVDGVKHGHGVFQLGDGSSYEGDFVDGEIEGQGLRRFADGSTYSGTFHMGEMHGQGVYISATGDRYVGQWVNNKRHGKGVLTLESGIRYEGQFHLHKKHGRGVFESPTGEKYTGEWEKDMRHGHGEAEFGNGNHYVGEWAHDLREGAGRFFLSISGLIYDGIWRDDAIDEPAKMHIVDLTPPPPPPPEGEEPPSTKKGVHGSTHGSHAAPAKGKGTPPTSGRGTPVSSKKDSKKDTHAHAPTPPPTKGSPAAKKPVVSPAHAKGKPSGHSSPRGKAAVEEEEHEPFIRAEAGGPLPDIRIECQMPTGPVCDTESGRFITVSIRRDIMNSELPTWSDEPKEVKRKPGAKDVNNSLNRSRTGKHGPISAVKGPVRLESDASLNTSKRSAFGEPKRSPRSTKGTHSGSVSRNESSEDLNTTAGSHATHSKRGTPVRGVNTSSAGTKRSPKPKEPVDEKEDFPVAVMVPIHCPGDGSKHTWASVDPQRPYSFTTKTVKGICQFSDIRLPPDTPVGTNYRIVFDDDTRGAAQLDRVSIALHVEVPGTLVPLPPGEEEEKDKRKKGSAKSPRALNHSASGSIKRTPSQGSHLAGTPPAHPGVAHAKHSPAQGHSPSPSLSGRKAVVKPRTQH